MLDGDGKLYTGTDDYLLLSMTTAGGANWIWESDGHYSCAPAVASDGTVFYAHGDDFEGGALGVFWALDPTLYPNWSKVIVDYSPLFGPVIGPPEIPIAQRVQGAEPAPVELPDPHADVVAAGADLPDPPPPDCQAPDHR